MLSSSSRLILQTLKVSYADALLACAGDGNQGQLGNGMGKDPEPIAEGAIEEINSTVPVAVAGDHTFVAIHTGGNFNCALDTSGQAWCWGQLGRWGCHKGYLVDRCAGEAPCFQHLVIETIEPQPVTFAGSGGAGTLGNGKTKDVAAPTAVAGNHTFVALSLGYEHACGLAVDALAGALLRVHVTSCLQQFY